MRTHSVKTTKAFLHILILHTYPYKDQLPVYVQILAGFLSLKFSNNLCNSSSFASIKTISTHLSNNVRRQQPTKFLHVQDLLMYR